MKYSLFTKLVLMGALCLFARLAFAQDAELLNPSDPYRANRSNAVTYEVDFSVVVTPPYKTQKLQVWLPIPTSDFGQEVSNSKLTTFPMQVEPSIATESEFDNKFAYFEFASPQGAQIIRHRFQIKAYELNWNLDPTKVIQVEAWPTSFNKYRQGDAQSVQVDERFTKLLDEIVPEKTNPFADLGNVMTWVQDNVEYDHIDASLRADAEQVLTKRRGHCSDYHSFCASLGRAMGVPTRVTYGLNAFPKNSPSHCKLEAYIVPYGWVSFDVSETQKLIGEVGKSKELGATEKSELIQLALARMKSGFRDNTWFLQTKGTDYELVPKASKRVPVVRTAYIEADGVPLADPDPANKNEKSFSWMTIHEYKADREVTYPFSDLSTLKKNEGKK